MTNEKTKTNASNIKWVEYWIQKAHSSFENYQLTATKCDEHRWICEIELPLINKTIKATSEKEVNAMLNAAEKAAKLINQYMEAHPELKILNRFKDEHWEIESDETGKLLSIGAKEDLRKQPGTMTKLAIDTLETVRKSIEKIVETNGESNNLFIQVLDRSLFDKDKTIEEIIHEVSEKIEKDYHMSCIVACGCKGGNSVIVVGTSPKEKGGLN